MTPHPPEAELAELAQGAAAEGRQAELEAHLERCAACRGVVASLLRALAPPKRWDLLRALLEGRA